MFRVGIALTIGFGLFGKVSGEIAKRVCETQQFSARVKSRGRIPAYCNLADGPSTSRSETLTVAVGFSPRFRPIRGSRVAERRWNDGESSNLRAVHSSLRDSCLTTFLHRGLKPTATVMKSLRD